jgi:NADH dehydrogenase
VAEPRVVIVGGGFAGLTAARELAGAPVQVTLVDRTNHHLFQPLLYQVAMAGLSAPDIAAPLRRVLRRQRNATVLLGEVRSIDPAARRMELGGGGEKGPDPFSLAYDFLILAPGAGHSYFGHDEWAPYAPGLKTVDDALEVRRRVLLAFEQAEREPARERECLTFVVVGGGPTGVELAGALAEIARTTLAGEFRRIDPRRARVLLVEAAPRVLPPYEPVMSERARAQLQRLGVEVRTGAPVTHVGPEGIRLGDETIPARTVLWAAGVAASPLGRQLGAPLDRAGRVKVNADLTVPGHPEVMVCGDLAALEGVPGVAPAAIQMGRHAARNVVHALRGEPLAPFRYRDKGSLATIGRSAAVAQLGRLRLSGFIAWVAWLAVHIFFLIGFRNRFIVMFEWAWAWFTYQRSARVIWGRPAAVGAERAPPAGEARTP